MHRVPNPPKLPVVGDPVASTRGGTRIRPAAAAAVLVGLSLSAGICSHCVATEGAVAAEPRTVAAPCAAEKCSAPAAAEPSAVVSPAGSFVVVSADADRGRQIAAHAEAMRREAFATLLGAEHPRPWAVRCEIHLHASADTFAAAVGSPPTSARGATSIEFLGDTTTLRRIDVVDDAGGAVPDALDHELVHVVLADHFVLSPPPRWADEGLALLFDPPEKQRAHEADFIAASRRGLAWSAAELVAMEDYPADARRQQVFYGQSAAVVRWLVARRDATTFIRFLDDEAADGIEAALARHYDLSLDSIALAWKEVAPINTLGLADRRP